MRSMLLYKSQLRLTSQSQFIVASEAMMSYGVYFPMLLCLIAASLKAARSAEVEKRQVGINTAAVVNDGSDKEGSETGFAAGLIGGDVGSKYFQYANVPAKDHYEFGTKKGSDHHFTERHEKAHPHGGEFKTKVRWGDKHGGYGEHYWDFNHDGHDHDGDGEESNPEAEYVPYEETQEQPKHQQRSSISRNKRQPKRKSDDVEFINDEAKYRSEQGLSEKHGGNYRRDPGADREKRERFDDEFDLFFDPSSQRIFNRKTGKQYALKPIL